MPISTKKTVFSPSSGVWRLVVADDEQGRQAARAKLQFIANQIHPARPLQALGRPSQSVFPGLVTMTVSFHPATLQELVEDGFNVGRVKQLVRIWHQVLRRDSKPARRRRKHNP